HKGQTSALNLGVKEANGEYIQYLDADDLISSNKLERQIERLAGEPKGTLATCKWARFYGCDPSTATFEDQVDFRDYTHPIEWLVQSWAGPGGTMPPVAWLMPRSVVEQIGPWNEKLSLCNDTEYFTRAVLACQKIAFCQDSIAYYRSG